MPKPPARKPPPWLWIGLGAIVVAALVAAVVASAGSGDDVTAAGVEQVRQVTTTGTPLPVLPASGADPAVGTVAPVVEGASFDDTPVTIDHGKGGTLVLVVAHWCPHCRREVPVLVDHLQQNELPAGVRLTTVSTAVSKSRPNFPPSAWLHDEGWTAPVLADDADGNAARAYGVSGYPFLVGLDGSGKVVGRLSGEFPMATFDALARAVAA